jgi:hypothetical protein
MRYLAIARAVVSDEDHNERDEQSPVAKQPPDAHLSAFRDERNECDEERSFASRLVADPAALRLDPALPWAHIYQGPVEATVPPPGWDGTLCAECQWPTLCCVLGPRGATLPGGPCPAYPTD